MATINELVAEYSRIPGDIKITVSNYRSDFYFIPFYNVGDIWYGINDMGGSIYWDSEISWKLYTEPRKKIKLYKWLVRNTLQHYYQETETYGKNQEEVQKYLHGDHWLVIARLDSTMIEVDE